ncbi:Rieske 2Fe-2S domain-containing protein [Sphingomonas lycopersici]|uniref:cholesterol 7-desaturase n=1 Tax=Sphingomonas lycopersici TaxID=2951807 RepID=A0AA41ZBU3_9SPHN|nr:Rieske 2Fe-2S domain-containing protein [Sphingomonas lycopersici]MCW6536457.1 Rieske 2Fe-2S domain-containing protein [Sphingomonas lycopersici]
MATTKDYRLGPNAFPRGWFMIAEDRELGDTPLSLHYLGRDLILYRGTSGPVLLDAYCPHMGTHLGKNESSFVVQDKIWLEGDSIRCPYHGWRFGADGRCNQIPYHDGPIPKAARIRSWPVRVMMGCIFMWHDPEERAPDYEPPFIPQWDDPNWVRWELDHLGTLPTHPMEIVDNMADIRHFDALHGSTVSYFRVEFEGHRYIQYQGGGHRTLTANDVMLETVTYYDGPGLLISHQYGSDTVLQFICHTPVDDGVVEVWHGLLCQKSAATPPGDDRTWARARQAVSRTAFVQDFEIWGNKLPARSILTIRSDGPFSKGRQWYGQFYQPADRQREIQRRLPATATCRGIPASREEALGDLAQSAAE